MLLEIKDSVGKGRGVFATTVIQEGECFERSPIIKIPMIEIPYLRRTNLSNYYFKWGKMKNDGAIALGFGSLFNHSFNPNAVFKLNLKNKTIDFYALREISIGEEITHNYTGTRGDKSKLWFSPID